MSGTGSGADAGERLCRWRMVGLADGRWKALVVGRGCYRGGCWTRCRWRVTLTNDGEEVEWTTRALGRRWIGGCRTS